jgi:pimeloyl-ACP methyl ester carboxylesterase
MAEDCRRLLDHLDIERADVMGYSMGARIAAFLAKAHPERTRSMILGGLGHHLIDGAGLPLGIADAMEAPSIDDLMTPNQRLFRSFAEATKSDLRAMAACIRGARQLLKESEARQIGVPVLVATGTEDEVAGDPHKLAAMFPAGQALDIVGRDHNRAVGDPIYKKGVLKFLAQRP